VNWGPIWDGAATGGGVNAYAQALALELTRLGHDLVWLSSGHTYASTEGAPRVVRHPDWLGVRVFEVVDSPVLAPSLPQFAEPGGEVSSPALERECGRLFRLLRPDVVHFHNLEGLSIGCVDAARAAGARVVFSLHNYHTVCPQVYLMRGHTSPCFGSDGGLRCERCIECQPPAAVRARRAGLEPPPEQPAPAPRGRRKQGIVNPETDEPRPPDDPNDPFPHAGLDVRGETRIIASEIGGKPFLEVGGANWAPLDNRIDPEPPGEGNAYGRRRAAMVAMLNRCDRVLAVSEFVRCKFASFGVREEAMQTLPIGSRVNRIVRRCAELLFDPPPFDPPRPVRLVFMGTASWYKGVQVLADALELLVPEVLHRIDLAVFAAGGQGAEWRFRRLEPRLGGLTLTHGYRPSDLPWMLGGRDLGVVPSTWWDNAPQTVFEFQGCGVPVLGAAVGGIPEFIRDGHDGLLFRGNDRCDLARALARVVREPELLVRLRANVRPPKPIEAHADEMAGLYSGLVEPEREATVSRAVR